MHFHLVAHPFGDLKPPELLSSLFDALGALLSGKVHRLDVLVVFFLVVLLLLGGLLGFQLAWTR